MKIHEFDELANEVWGILHTLTREEMRFEAIEDCVGFRYTYFGKSPAENGILFTVARDSTPSSSQYLYSDKMFREVSRRMGHLRYHALLVKGALTETKGTVETDEGMPALYLNRRAKL